MLKTRRACLQQFGTMAALGFAASTMPLRTALSQTPAKPSGPIPWTRSRPFAMPAITRKPAELIAARLVPPYDKKFVRGPQDTQTPNRPGVWPGAADMGGTGEREDIGPMVDDAALWLVNAAPPSDMIVWAESHGLVAVHFRMDDAGKPNPAGKYMVDVFKFPKATCYGENAGSPYFQVSGPVRPEMAHYPSTAYVPYLATGDLFYLQEVQDIATFMIINAPPGYVPTGVLREDQTRGWAWGLRDIAQAYLATPDNPPAPLLPKSYWKTILDKNRDWFAQRWVKNGVGKVATGSHFAVDLDEGRVGPWQQDMLGFIMGWMVWCGEGTGDQTLSSWRGNYDWFIQQAIDRTSGKAGYPRSKALQYSFPKNGSNMGEMAKANGLTEKSGEPLFINNDLRSYAVYLRGNLKFATLNGVPGAQESFAYVDASVKWIPAKWAI